MGKYAVVIYCTFDSETFVYMFDTYEEACRYLEKIWQNFFDTEIRGNGNLLDYGETYHEDGYAQIKLITGEMQVFEVSEVKKPLTFGGEETIG